MSEATPDSTADSTADILAAIAQGAAGPVGTAKTEALPHEAPDQLELPDHARGLLKIRVALRVTLASQRKPIQEIIELGPGSIVKFDKTCDEPLELSVGDHPIAMGEVVKVGDKFGLRIGGLTK